MNELKNTAVILSAGTGSRFGADIPKQYTLLEGKPVLFYTINSFVRAGVIDSILIVAQPEYFDECRNIWQKYFEDDHPEISFFVTKGGSHRQESLYLGCKYLSGISEHVYENIVLSHCAARPVVSTDIIKDFHFLPF